MPIELFAHDARWAAYYEAARADLTAAFGPYALDIQHVGSTSVPGLAAKPVIDIAVLLPRYPLPDSVIAAVCRLGYEYKGEYGIARRHYFVKAGPPIRYHVHAYDQANGNFQNHVLFRDYLRAFPAAAREYEELKRALAARFGDDTHTYADHKSDFVRAILARARTATGDR
jgi:GrpB-like predicted nucleotidyltransferase (UPF0157 family)